MLVFSWVVVAVVVAITSVFVCLIAIANAILPCCCCFSLASMELDTHIKLQEHACRVVVLLGGVRAPARVQLHPWCFRGGTQAIEEFQKKAVDFGQSVGFCGHSLAWQVLEIHAAQLLAAAALGCRTPYCTSSHIPNGIATQLKELLPKHGLLPFLKQVLVIHLPTEGNFKDTCPLRVTSKKFGSMYWRPRASRWRPRAITSWASRWRFRRRRRGECDRGRCSSTSVLLWDIISFGYLEPNMLQGRISNGIRRPSPEGLPGR